MKLAGTPKEWKKKNQRDLVLSYFILFLFFYSMVCRVFVRVAVFLALRVGDVQAQINNERNEFFIACWQALTLLGGFAQHGLISQPDLHF